MFLFFQQFEAQNAIILFSIATYFLMTENQLKRL